MTPVRRSARKQPLQLPVTSLLCETDFAYAPNPMHAPAPEQSPRTDDGAFHSDTTEAAGSQGALPIGVTDLDDIGSALPQEVRSTLPGCGTCSQMVWICISRVLVIPTRAADG